MLWVQTPTVALSLLSQMMGGRELFYWFRTERVCMAPEFRFLSVFLYYYPQTHGISELSAYGFRYLQETL